MTNSHRPCRRRPGSVALTARRVTRSRRRALTACLLLTLSAAGARRAGAAPPEAGPPLEEAYRRKAAGDVEGARAAFAAARATGADPQPIALELGYLAVARGDVAEARIHFDEAARGPDAGLAARARAELGYLPRTFWADLYADAYGWARVRGGGPPGPNLVPTLRIRGLARLSPAADVHAYAFAQATRDLASTGRGAGGVPEIYADNHALLGAGLLARALGGRLGLFAQAGPALNLLDDGRDRVAFDARAGLFLGLESARCAPGAAGGPALTLVPCAELYAEGVYVSRFDHDVIAFARARAGATWLVTGPVAWQLVAEARAAKDRNDDFYNNFFDAGGGLRLRLTRPSRVDLLVGAHVGSYFGLENRDPAPSPLGYADLRLQFATYLEL